MDFIKATLKDPLQKKVTARRTGNNGVRIGRYGKIGGYKRPA